MHTCLRPNKTILPAFDFVLLFCLHMYTCHCLLKIIYVIYYEWSSGTDLSTHKSDYLLSVCGRELNVLLFYLWNFVSIPIDNDFDLQKINSQVLQILLRLVVLDYNFLLIGFMDT